MREFPIFSPAQLNGGKVECGENEEAARVKVYGG
jgi:hypothetical protein